MDSATKSVPISARSRGWAVLSQFSMFGCQVILAAIIRYTVGRNDAFVRHYASEALNLQVIWIIPWLLIAAAQVATHSGLLGVTLFAYFDTMAIYAAVVGVIGAVKACRGKTWAYPFNIRIVDQ
jgi:uncharacterized Tic20 family protein